MGFDYCGLFPSFLSLLSHCLYLSLYFLCFTLLGAAHKQDFNPLSSVTQKASSLHKVQTLFLKEHDFCGHEHGEQLPEDASAQWHTLLHLPGKSCFIFYPYMSTVWTHEETVGISEKRYELCTFFAVKAGIWLHIVVSDYVETSCILCRLNHFALA